MPIRACILEIENTARFIECIRYHMTVPSNQPIKKDINRFYSKESMKRKGWYLTPNGWICPECSRNKRNKENRYA